MERVFKVRTFLTSRDREGAAWPGLRENRAMRNYRIALLAGSITLVIVGPVAMYQAWQRTSAYAAIDPLLSDRASRSEFLSELDRNGIPYEVLPESLGRNILRIPLNWSNTGYHLEVYFGSENEMERPYLAERVDSEYGYRTLLLIVCSPRRQ
jgi:hypothetical protein